MNINVFGKDNEEAMGADDPADRRGPTPGGLPLAHAQDQYDQYDPPGRVARLGYMQGSVSFQPAGESEWVEAVANRPYDDRRPAMG